MVKNGIELCSVTAEDSLIKYRIRDCSGLNLLKNKEVEAYIKFDNSNDFGFSLSQVPPAILALPVSLYLLPITYFYAVELVLPYMDKMLYEALPSIYNAYSRIYGPFSKEWKGSLTVKNIVENKLPENTGYEKIVFFSGGVDACSAGTNNPGGGTVLVSIPSIEYKSKQTGNLRKEKYSLLQDFSKAVGSKWLLISNNFNDCVFNDEKIQKKLTGILDSPAFKFDGWFGIKYMANMCSVAPFAYSMGIKALIMGSTFQPEGNNYSVNYDGTNPELSDSISFAGISFSEQDELHTRRSKKVQNIISWFNSKNKKIRLWTCFDDKSYQCGICPKCITTQLNILCAKENPKDWGFDRFSEKQFSRLFRSYSYYERCAAWAWDNFDAIDDNVVYPYCDKLLHWLKKIGYREYLKKSFFVREFILCCKRLFMFHRYPHYVKRVFEKLKEKTYKETTKGTDR